MARIVYGVMGDSLGHVSRARAVAQEMPEHDYLFVGGGAVSGLERDGHRVIPAPVLGTHIGASRVRVLATIAGAMSALPQVLPVIDRLAGLMDGYRPDLIVSDYEFFTQMAALRLKRPCVSLDNQHMLTLCRYEPPPGHRLSRLMTLLLIRTLYSRASLYLVTSFHALPAKDPEKTRVLPPVLRQRVGRYPVSQGDHGVIYLRGGPSSGLLEALRSRRSSYVVYGFGDRLPEGNLIFRAFSDEAFLKDLASCRYVLCNGGHSTISEALYYGKPVFCTPVGLFYEQLVNAHLLFTAGYGDYWEGGPGWEGTISRFENRLEEYTARIRDRDFWGNKAVAEALLSLMPGERPA
ncbi:MAG: glycosyltransferase family protein [Thermodesulfobacteriota bacterium]